MLKSGDTFAAGAELSRGGRSAAEPIVITSYGTGSRPVIQAPIQYLGSNQPEDFWWNYVTITNLNFVGGDASDPSESNGLQLLGRMRYITIEGNTVSYWHTGIQVWGFGLPVNSISDIAVRRNVSFGSTNQGMIINGVTTVLVEENIFDYNGHAPGVEGGTGFHHNIYLQEIQNATVRGNIFARGASHGSKLRSDVADGFNNFAVENNLYYQNSLSLDYTGTPAHDVEAEFIHNFGEIKDNVFTANGRTFTDTSVVDYAIILENTNSVTLSGNIFAHKPLYGNNYLLLLQVKGYQSNLTIRDSVVYDWILGAERTTPEDYFESRPEEVNGFTLANNEIDLVAATYVDPTRTVGSYYASIGGTNNAIAFFEAARGMSKATWNVAYTADAVNDYIRAGFLHASRTYLLLTASGMSGVLPIAANA
jgi:hypothetical protein